ncbi:tetratricopeptide repeat-containing sensor histidine kinase [Epilithonimonas xixisoli]|uniref:histidine kinase n=1 Tax=Epilithonimonas xixisoli TaxID=1476462 RepID=A0A4R8IIJ2_9FLAO|nr:sensor histidine kinase [Epilithonimonas xixisoli]TDX86763.1 histidine kinase/DNA gyrase B/HSP90-like ATPase [Epilithonimonas xixisoli]
MIKLLLFFSTFTFINVFSQSKKQIDSISNLPMTYIQTNLKTVIPQLRKNALDAKKSRNLKAEAKTYASLSLAFYYNGDYDENIKYSLKSIEIFEKLNDLENVSSVYGEMGFRLKATNIRDAEKYMMKGLKIAEKANFTKPLLSIYNNYGVIKNNLNQKDSALIYFHKGLEIKTKSNDSVGIPYSLNNIGEAYLQQKKFDLAKQYFDKAMAQRVALKDDYGIADNFAYNGDLFLAMKNYPLAIQNFEKSVKLAEKYKITNLLRHDYGMLSQAYELNQNLPKALEYFKKSQALKDQIINKETYDKMAELQMKFDTVQKEKEILKQKNQEKKRLNTIKILSILFVSLIIISFLIYRTLFLKNKQQKQEYELTTAISKIETQNKLQEQRLSISRDLHDNIGAQLTFIISSVETLKQAFNIKDEKINSKLSSISTFTKDTITELRDTIWAMNHSEIDFNEIRSRILNFVEKAQKSNDFINIIFERENALDSLKFTSVEGMNIYRITQEAVNNAMKYSEAKNINLTAKTIDNQIEIKITDDGKGFDTEEIELGNGIRNMQKRASELNADFEINSEKGNGTQIILRIPKV